MKERACDYCDQSAAFYVCTAGGEEILAHFCEQHRARALGEFGHPSFEIQPMEG